MGLTIRATAAFLISSLVGALWSSGALAQTLTRTSSFAYDATSGLLTQEVIEPDTPALRLQTDYTYNSFGQKTGVTVSGVDITTRSASTIYDAKGQFPVSASNALTHGESWEYDPSFGAPTKHTGPNGLITIWTYDSFGRKTLEVRADGTRTTWSYQYCSGVAGGTASCPTGGAYLVQVKALAADGTTPIGPTAVAFYDQLDRVIANDTQGFDGSAIRTATEYDALGRVAKKSRPYFVSGGTPKWTSYTYDALGRVLTETEPDSGVTTRTYSGLVASVTNGLSQTKTSTSNSQGQVVAIKDAQNNSTTFAYDPFGSLTKVTDAAGNITTYGYDTRGRKIAASDPDMGSSTYSYDVLDKLKSQTNAASEVTTLSYDLLGRMTQRVDPSLTSTWTWDTATKGIGKLATASTNGGYSRAHSYDTLGRPTQVALTISSATYSITTGYDSSSRVSSVTYPSGFAVTYGYNATGYQSQLSNTATSQVYWTANARDAELHLTQQTAGNGVVTSQVFDVNTGMLTSTTAGSAGAVQNQSYTYDVLDKLLTRSDANTSLSESFDYDVLNRLTSSTVSLTPTPLVATFSYNTIGNLISKTDVGTYTYPAPGQPRPHGVTSISGGVINTSFSYDAKGNMTSGNGLTVAYTASNKTASITRGTTTVSFDHDPEHQRYSQLSASGLTLYIGGGGVLAERFAGSSTVQWTNYLVAAGQMIGVFVERSDETVATRYFHLDHLGSVSVITDENGVVVERLSYDAWGLRRHPDGTPDPAGAITSQSTSGFTGHEHLAEVGLIHMNGRVYDPLLARFGTPDPTTEDPFSTQGWNRYSYVGNSPVNFTDPSGYCFLGCFWQPIFKAIQRVFQKIPILGSILQIAVASFCPPCAVLASAFVAGVTSGDLGMAIKAGLISMVTHFAFDAISSAVGVTSGGGFGGGPALSGREALYQQYGPPMGVTTLPPLYVDSVPLSPDAAANGVAGSWDGFAQNLLRGIGAVAVSSLSGVGQQAVGAQNYLHRAVDPCGIGLDTGRSGWGGGETFGLCGGGGLGSTKGGMNAGRGSAPRASGKVEGPEFGGLRDHFGRHGPDLGTSSINQYYNQAVGNMSTGQSFRFRIDGANRMGYVTRLGPDEFMFTSATFGGGRIFTHMQVNTQYLRNIGITLPSGF